MYKLASALTYLSLILLFALKQNYIIHTGFTSFVPFVEHVILPPLKLISHTLRHQFLYHTSLPHPPLLFVVVFFYDSLKYNAMFIEFLRHFFHPLQTQRFDDNDSAKHREKLSFLSVCRIDSLCLWTLSLKYITA